MCFFWMSSKELITLCLSLAMDWLDRKKGIDPVPKSKACRIFGSPSAEVFKTLKPEDFSA